jgi:hypothetical protein
MRSTAGSRQGLLRCNSSTRPCVHRGVEGEDVEGNAIGVGKVSDELGHRSGDAYPGVDERRLRFGVLSWLAFSAHARKQRGDTPGFQEVNLTHEQEGDLCARAEAQEAWNGGP